MTDDHGEITSTERRDTHTDDLELATIQETGLTQTYETARAQPGGEALEPSGLEANVILIAHPDNRRLGTRYRLTPETSVEIGRNPQADISLPEVLSISRDHARLSYRGDQVTIEDLGSTNGTYINGQQVHGTVALESGDRFQVAAVHFKFLREEDVEHAYYEAIYNLVVRDGLTDIYNKRKYLEEAEREVARAKRHGRPLSLVLFDLDGFKTVNDTYGHLCGDFLLKQLVSTTRALLRAEQILARVGGDEFVILAPETTCDGAFALSERLRDRIAGLDYRYGEVSISTTCSFGVAELEGDMDSPDELFEVADRALYESKRAGGDRVTVGGVGRGDS